MYIFTFSRWSLSSGSLQSQPIFVGHGSDGDLIWKLFWFYFGQLGLSGATGTPTSATFFLLVPPGDERDFFRPGHLLPLGGRRDFSCVETTNFSLSGACFGEVTCQCHPFAQCLDLGRERALPRPDSWLWWGSPRSHFFMSWKILGVFHSRKYSETFSPN